MARQFHAQTRATVQRAGYSDHAHRLPDPVDDHDPRHPDPRVAVAHCGRRKLYLSQT